MIYAITYSDDNYTLQRKYNCKTAYSKGKADKVIEYTPADISKEFKDRNASIFNYKLGAGLWIWKPYLILKTLLKIDTGDYLFYCDAGSIYINKIQFLIDCIEREKQEIMCFELPLLARQFTKRETFKLMDFSDYSTNQILANYILIKKSKFSIRFVRNWLNYMEDERISSPDHFCLGIDEFDDFVAHREDQSILSILARKSNISLFRDPSDYGLFQWQYISNGWSYSPKKYNNSPYPIIILANRKVNPIIYKIKSYLKIFLYKIGLLSETTFRIIHIIKFQ